MNTQRSLDIVLGKRLILIILIPLFLFCLIVLTGIAELTLRQMNINHSNTKIYVEESLREKLFTPYETLIYLNQILENTPENDKSLQSFIDMAMKTNTLFLNFYVLDPGGEVMYTSASNLSQLGADYSLYDFFREPERDMSLWARPVISSATSNVSYVISLKRADGIVLVCFYSFDGIQQLIESISTDTAQVGILNDELFLMAHTDYHLVEERVQDQFIDFTKDLQIIRISNQYQLVQWGYIREYRLYVVLYEKLFPFYAPLLFTVSAFLVLFVGLYLLIHYYNKRQLTRLHRDMEELASAADEVNKGNYGIRFKRFQYRELSRLATSFNRMTRTLKDAFDTLNESNEKISQTLSEKNIQYKKARAREEELNVILENSLTGIVFLNGRLDILRLSRKAREILNLLDFTNLEGREFLSLIPDIFRSEIHSQLTASLRSSRVGSQQYSWNRRILEISTIPVEEGLSIGRGIVVTIRDITASVEANAQLNRAKRLEAIGTLAGGVAHDFNNILQIIYGYIDLIKATADAEEEKYLLDMEEAADKGTSLIQQLLTFGRKSTTEKSRFSLDSLITENQILIKKMTGDAIRLNLDLHDGGLLIDGRRNELERVIVNLIINARDAMDNRGEIGINTDEKEREGAPHVLLEVSDQGCGIPGDVMDKIFDPFFTTKELGKGTGLGLSTVFGVVKDNGGQIEVESSIGKGTTFRLYFPGVREIRN